MNFAKMELNEYTQWILEKKDWKDVSSVDKLASDTVIHLLNTAYFQDIDGTSTTFKNDADATYWSNGELFVEDEIFRVVIDGEYYIYSHLYLTTNNRIIIVVVKPEDIWSDELDTEGVPEDLEPIYFMLEY